MRLKIVHLVEKHAGVYNPIRFYTQN